jgi:chemotaxis protein CheD
MEALSRTQIARNGHSLRDRFSHIQQRYDARIKATVAVLHAGDYYVAIGGELISTVLGSCVSACVRDSYLRIGGMNHFMLPMDGSDGTSSWGSDASAATRFGNVAMERLINELLKLGARRETLEFKLVGGGKVLESLSDVGARNIQFVREYMRAESFKVIGEDLGGVYPRKVLYDPASGSARVKRLARSESHVVADETRYLRDMGPSTLAGDVELFQGAIANRDG